MPTQKERAKMKQAIKSQPHIAEASASSDLVKLTSEFEALASQLAELDEQTQEIADDAKAAEINYRIGVEHRAKRSEAIGRQRRTLLTSFDNVRELLFSNVQSKMKDVYGEQVNILR